MDITKHELQAIIRKLYTLLPVDLAFNCVQSILHELADVGYISVEEFASLKAISKAYSDILGG